MFERFDQTTVRAIVLATDATRKLGQDAVGTAQLLIGIAGVPGIASGTLASFGVYVKNLRSAVINIVGKGKYLAARDVPFTPKAQRALQLAWEEAESYGCDSIMPEHILVALLANNDDDDVAFRVLEELCGDVDEIRSVLVEVINGMPVPVPIEEADWISEGFSHESTGATSLHEATRNLYATYAFIKHDSVPDSMLDWLEQKESLVGVYINAEDNYLAVCKEGIHLYDGDAKVYAGFDNIASVELPDTEDDRYLKLVLRAKKNVLMLPVWHETEDVLDLFHLYDFILFTLKTPAAKRDIRNINSKNDLIDYLRQPSVATESLIDLAAWLEDGSPQVSWLEALKIEQSVWQDPNALRLLALIFTRFPNAAGSN